MDEKSNKTSGGIIWKVLMFIFGISLIISINTNSKLTDELNSKNDVIKANAYNYVDNVPVVDVLLSGEIDQKIILASLKATENEKNGKFTGQRVNGLKSGDGIYEWNDGSIYEGEFSNDLIEGKGSLTIPERGTYIGNFIAGKKSGTGTFKFANGDSYEGEWKDDKMEGEGKYIFANGDYYTGSFSNNKFNGQGTYRTGGKSYSGIWKNNAYNQ